MINRIKPLLNKLIPQNLAVKGLSKIDPKINKFITTATSFGYGADQALDFLRNQFDTEDTEGLRPDIAANKRQQQQSELLPKVLGKAAQIGLGATGAGLAANLGLEVLQGIEENELQPQDSSINELSQKINPLQEIAQYDATLAQFIEERLDQGDTPDQAGARAMVNPNFAKLIKSIEKQSKENFVDMLMRLFGGGMKQQASQQQQPQGIDPQFAQILQQGNAILQRFRGGNG